MDKKRVTQLADKKALNERKVENAAAVALSSEECATQLRAQIDALRNELYTKQMYQMQAELVGKR